MAGASTTEAQERRISLHSQMKRRAKQNKKIWARINYDPASERSRSSSFDKDVISATESIALEEIPSYEKSTLDSEFLKTVLERNFVFADLSQDELAQLVGAFQSETFPANTTITEQGDQESPFFFYILQTGSVRFVVDGVEVFRLDEEGSCFGELELFYDAPRAASTIAVRESLLWKVGQDVFRRVVSRYAVSQDQPELRETSPLLSQCDNDTLHVLSEAFTTVKFRPNERIITKGDVGEVFYIIQEGSVLLSDMGSGTTHMMDQTLHAGEWFGGHELKTGDPRFLNATALTNVVVLALDQEKYLEVLCPALQPILDRETYKHFLRALPIFANSNSAFTDQELGLLVDKLEQKSSKAGDVVVDGNATNAQRSLWIIRRGNVTLDDGYSTHHLTRGDVFGDKWLNEAARSPDHTSISAATAKATCEEDTRFFVLDGNEIELVIGDLTRLGASMPYQYKGLDTSLQLEDIQKHRVLGKGEFAVVYLASDKVTKKTYALKTLSKVHLLEHATDAVTSTKNEVEVMKNIAHPFIMGMHASFQDNRYVYLLLPLFQGGELFGLIYKEDGSKYGLKKDDAIFYSACIVEALGHLHSRHIVHRDLKPDNVMINGEGYAVLIDMGLAKFVVGKTYTMVGTPSYISPEVLMGRGHNHVADFWGFGCLLYEMLDGNTPFYWEGSTQKDEFEAIMRLDYKCPDAFPDSAKALIDQLLVLDPEKRLGSGIRGHKQVETCPWFDSISFKRLRKMEIPSPWVPELKDSLDVSNFAEYDESEIQPPYRELTPHEQLLFKGF